MNFLARRKQLYKVLKSMDKWYGVTYKEDKPVVVAAIQKLKDDGLYPQKLWEERRGKSKRCKPCGIKEVIDSFDFGGKLEERLAYLEMATLMRLTVLYFPQKPDRSAIFSRK